MSRRSLLLMLVVACHPSGSRRVEAFAYTWRENARGSHSRRLQCNARQQSSSPQLEPTRHMRQFSTITRLGFDSQCVIRNIDRTFQSFAGPLQASSFAAADDSFQDWQPPISVARRWNPLKTLLRLTIVLACYTFHLTILSQRQFVFPVQLFPNDRGHFTGIGYDSVAGIASLLIYMMTSQFKRNSSNSKKQVIYNRSDERKRDKTVMKQSSFPWHLPRHNLRFRLTTTLTFLLLIQAYFLTGRMSIFWEDLLYELSARDFEITVPLFRALTVLLGHVSWVVVGVSLLTWLPRPPRFFQAAADANLITNGIGNIPASPNNNKAGDDDSIVDDVPTPRLPPPPTSGTRVVKKLFRTDISTLYSQAGLPPTKATTQRLDVTTTNEKKNDGSQQPPSVYEKGNGSNESGSRREQMAAPASLDSNNPYYWFSSGSNHWMWWTIGGYFVSSWLFNLADLANQYILPSTILQDAQESTVSQLVNPENNDFLASAVGYIAPCITAPWWEEVLYRGFCLPALTQLIGYQWAVLWQGIVFSAHHMSLTGALPLAVLGWTWAVVYTKSRNIFTVMMIHMLWNSRVFLGSWLGL
ncbi:hypothetical protein MPSEU_000332900 [Mayamaea pseudoterrestris]|nr:hypothetical protein MPSEU_000332900 [Mayamaea pseudoterrestris]